MSRRKSLVRTPALLAARRANALRSTGPFTPQGKARVALNALQHGHYARGLRSKLVQAGDPQCGWFHAEIARRFGVSTPEERRQAEQYAAQASYLARRVAGFRTKLECALESMAKLSWYPLVQLRIAIVERRRRIGLVFWL